MNTGDIRLLLSYNTWANRRILAAARLLTAEALQRDLGTSYGSVQGTLVHLLWAEWIWLERWLGRSPKQVFGTGDFPDLAAIEERLATIQRGQEAFIETLTDDRVKTRISYENVRGERWEYSLGHMMQHIVNHSTYHRGQVVTLLRQLGQTPPPTDFLVYFDEGGS